MASGYALIFAGLILNAYVLTEIRDNLAEIARLMKERSEKEKANG